MRRTLYWKRLLIVLAVAVVSAGAVFALHRVQVRSQSSIFKERAQAVAAAAETDPSKRGDAIALYRQYLKFTPGDREAYQKYANLNLDDAKADPRPANVERAAAGVEDFLRNFRDHPAERQKLAELYLSMGQLPKLPLAKQHVKILLDAPGDGKNSIELRELAAAVEYGLTPDAPDAAIDHLEKALATGTAPVRTHVKLMEFYHLNKKDKDRVNKITQGPMAALRGGRFANNLEARVAAARFEMVLKNLDIARGDLKVAFESLGGENDADAQLARAELELAGAKAEDMPARNAAAEAHLRKAFGLDPKNIAVGLLLAEVLVRQNKRGEGVDVLKKTASTLGAYSDKYMILIDRLLDLGEQEFSASLIESKLADPTRSTLTNYARGRLAALKSDWPAALKLLEGVSPDLVRVPEFHKRAMVALAVCYASMQNPDRQLDYCRQALRDDGGYVLAIIGEAEALARMGRTDEAVQRFRLIVNLYQLAPYRSELVRLELLTALAQPAETRDWRRFDEAVRPDEGKTAEIEIYSAEADIARGKAAEAAKWLREWLDKNPKHPKAGAVWVALARATDGGKPDSAERVLKDAEAAVGNTVDVRLARAALLIARAKLTSPDELKPLAAGAEAMPTDERFQLNSGLGQAMSRVADRPAEGDAAKVAQAARDAAIGYLRAAADLQPKDLMIRAMLLDQALAAGRFDVVDVAIREMAGIEGENGPVGALATIAVKLPQVRAMADPAPGVKELRALALRVRELRPGWSRVYVALAQLDELEGLNDAALENYNAAIERGERQEAVVRRAVDLYRLKQEDLKAVALLNRLVGEGLRLPDDLDRYRVIQQMLAETPKDARESIDRIAPFEASDYPFKSPDYRLMQLRGALLAAIREDAESLKAFRRAVEIKDRLPETWIPLVEQLVKQGQIASAKGAVGEAKTKLVAPPEASAIEKSELQLALGTLHELVGDLPEALTYYLAARELAPQELNPTRQLVHFYERTGNGAQAEALLHAAKAAAAPSVARWARRQLALTLIARPDGYNRRAEALALIEQNLAAAPKDSDDLRARATVWTIDPVTREQGISELRNFGRRSDLTPDQFLLLGQLAFDQGKYAEAAQYFGLAARVRPGVAARHMVGLVRAYLALSQQHPPASPAASDMLKLAEDAAERLKTHFPASWEATSEQARVLHRRSRERAARAEFDDAKRLADEAVALVKKYPGWDAGVNLAGRTGPLFEEMGLVDEAKAAYTKFLSSGEKNSHAPLAVLHIRQKESAEAVALARKYAKDTPPLLTARLMTGAARAKRLDPATESEIEQFLDAALKDAVKPEMEAALIGSKAELLDAQGRYDDAIAEYRRSLTKGKSDLVVNNLSMLLALHTPKLADEAVQMMSELIGVRGPVPAYLDTRAVAYLVSSRPAEATKDLQMALVQLERPAYRFHLGWAIDLDAVKERQIFAVDELKRARQIGLTAADLHPLEARKYLDLLNKYRLPLDEVK